LLEKLVWIPVILFCKIFIPHNFILFQSQELISTIFQNHLKLHLYMVFAQRALEQMQSIECRYVLVANGMPIGDDAQLSSK
jgi:hypothetical protein